MGIQRIKSFSIIGISVRTSNENGQAGQDIPALWNKFMKEKIAEQIPGKIDGSIYCIYTDYEKDHTKPYTAILGCKVDNLNNIPKEMVGKTFEEAGYEKFVATGNILEGSVFNEWTKIWNSDLDRAFKADFELYGEKSQNPVNAEVDIFVGIN